jgi:D-alanine-D-alanine ligase
MKRIAILMGGNSPEREISINSGLAVVKACRNLGYTPITIEVDNNISDIVDPILSSDVVFSVLHGGDGENGVMQGFLDSLKVLYTGSGVLGSAICMNKSVSKTLVRAAKLPTPNWVLINKREKLENLDVLRMPLVVKPNDLGSTIGLTIVKNQEAWYGALDLAFQFSNEIIVEQYISGRELTAAIVGQTSLSLVEIIPQHGLYDYECKYQEGMSSYECPAKLNESVSEKIRSMALEIYKILNCNDYGRVDFRLDDNNQPWFLELNTLPGMTSTSLVPKAAKADGHSFTNLIEMIINEALK